MDSTTQKSEWEVRQLKYQGKDFYPLTNAKSVIDSNGDSVDIILSEMDKKSLEGYSYEGQAIPDTIPTNLVPKAKVFYLAVTKGVYNNFKNGDTPIEITEEGTWAIKHDTTKWYLEKMELSTTTDKVYDETTKTYVEDSLITPHTETYAMVDDEIEVLLRTALRKTAQPGITEAERNTVYQNLGLDAKFASLENRITDGYKYIGLATPKGTPSVETGHVYYIATEKGTYENYGNFSFDNNGIYILKYDGNWHMENVYSLMYDELDVNNDYITFKDSEGNEKYPKTNTEQVFDKDQLNIEQKLNKIYFPQDFIRHVTERAYDIEIPQYIDITNLYIHINDENNTGSVFILIGYINADTFEKIIEFKSGDFNVVKLTKKYNKIRIYQRKEVPANYILTIKSLSVGYNNPIILNMYTIGREIIVSGDLCKIGNTLSFDISYNGPNNIYILAYTSDTKYETLKDINDINNTFVLDKDYQFIKVYKGNGQDELKVKLYCYDSTLTPPYARNFDLFNDVNARNKEVLNESRFTKENLTKEAAVLINLDAENPYHFQKPLKKNLYYRFTFSEFTVIDKISVIGIVSKKPVTSDTLITAAREGQSYLIKMDKDYEDFNIYAAGASKGSVKLEFTEYGDLSESVKQGLSDNSVEHVSFVKNNNNLGIYDITDINIGDIISLKLDEYSNTENVMIFGITNYIPLEYNTITDNWKVGQELKIKIDKIYHAIRIYKREINDEINFTIKKNNRLSIVENLINNTNDEVITFTTDNSGHNWYDYTSINYGDLYELKLDSYEGQSPIFVMGIIEYSPQKYDLITNNWQLGEKIYITIKSTYKSIRVYKRDNSVLTFRIKHISKLNQCVLKLEQDVESYDKVDNLVTLTDDPLKRIIRYPGFGAIIHNWGFIADSLGSGCMQCHDSSSPDKTVFLDLFEYSWGQRLCQLLGVDGYNFSYSGQSTKGWIDGSKLPPETTPDGIPNRIWTGAQTNLKQAYIIALGTNDKLRKEYPIGNINTDINLDNYENNAKTFAGYYAGIIQRVRSVNPRCIIFCSTFYGGDPDYNPIIRNIVTLFDKCYLIDREKYSVPRNDEFKELYNLAGHRSASGYQYEAYLMNTYIDWIIRNNYDDFKDIALVNTKYIK